jgi:hypothetical protein
VLGTSGSVGDVGGVMLLKESGVLGMRILKSKPRTDGGLVGLGCSRL